MRYILAYDVGTTAIKAVLIEQATQKMCSASVPCNLYLPQDGWAEQDADELWACVCEASHICIEKEKADPAEIGGVVISAPWKHIIPLDENYHPIEKAMIWMDGRAIPQAARINQLMGYEMDFPQGYWPRLLWLKENRPEVWAKAKHIAGINDYFKYRATGNLVTECSDDFIHSPNARLQKHYTEVLEKIGLAEDLDKFPPMIACTDCAGYLTADGAAQMGLQEGTPMFGGFGDLPAVFLGSGMQEPGMAHIYIGTSSWFGELFEDQVEGYCNLWFTCDNEHQGATHAVTTGGRAYEWVINKFYADDRKQLGDDIYSLLDADMASVAPGSDGLIVTHWLNGELEMSKNARTVFFNVNEQHTRKHFVRAMLESLCYTHRIYMEKYIKLHGCKPKELRVVGGGACSPVWMQIMADVMQTPVVVPDKPRYVGTMGSYYCALVGMGIKPDFSDLCRPGKRTVYTPNPENAAVYDKMFGIYKDLYPHLKDLYDRMNDAY